MCSYIFPDCPGYSCQVVVQARLSLLQALESIELRTQRNPWSAQAISGCFDKTYKVVVLYEGEISRGFAVIYNTRISTDLLSIGVDPCCQGRGLGRFLLRCTLKEADAGGAGECFLEVRVSNERAIALYHSFDFAIVGTRRNYYPAVCGFPAEDAYTMRLDNIRAGLQREQESRVHPVPSGSP